MWVELEKCEHWLAVIVDSGVNLTKWEENFVESVRDRLEDGRGLSERQAEILEGIFFQIAIIKIPQNEKCETLKADNKTRRVIVG